MDGWRSKIEVDGNMESKKLESVDRHIGNLDSTIFMNIEADEYVGNPSQPSYKIVKCVNEDWTKLEHIIIKVGNMNEHMKNPYSTIS